MRRDRQRFARASCGHDRCRRRGVPSPTTGQARASSIGREVFAEDASATLWTSLGTWTSLHAHEQPQRRRRKNQRAHKARPEQHLLVRTVAGTQSQCVLPRDAKDNTNTWPRRTQTRREETRGGTRSSSAQRRQRSMAPRESGTHWPPGWRTQDERTSTGTRGERLVEKNGGAKDGAKGVAHNESPRRGEPTLRWGAWLSGDSRTKVSEGQQRRLGVTQGRKYCGASHATLDTAREEQQRSQLQRARRERVVARRQSEACGGGGQSNDGSARPRKGQKKGARRVVMSKAADEQGAKVTQRWRLNGKGAQGGALPCNRRRSEGGEGTSHGGCLRGRAESDHASTLPLAEGRAITFSNQRTASRDTRGPRHATQPQGSHTAGRKMGARTACQARSKGEALASCGEHLDKRGGSAGEKNTLQTEDRRGRRTAKRGMKKQRHDDERAALAVPWNRTMRDREVAKLDLGK
ncbi:hypothetical protein ERJ75_001185300 [Trypanosoma vivax]|nr:hypothetical protein ERJ75_001185300 [Trypanosoma vivax]